MSKPEHTRPFSIAHAKATAPYCCRDGHEATVSKFNGRDPSYPLVGYLGEHDMPTKWTAEGFYVLGDGASNLDLVMTPLGYVEGKPFFVGDEIVGTSGQKFIAEPRDWRGDIDTWRWPKPARQFPITQMSDGDICSAFLGGGPVVGAYEELLGYRRIANVVLRHAVESGQVVVTAEVPDLIKLSKDGQHIEKMRSDIRISAARDMAVAEAVKSVCEKIIHDPFYQDQCKRDLGSIDLAAIIAKVQP